MDVGYKKLLRGFKKTISHSFKPTKSDSNFDEDQKKSYPHWEQERFEDEIRAFIAEYLGLKNPTDFQVWAVIMMVAPTKEKKMIDWNATVMASDV